jgi:hypothetical protein
MPELLPQISEVLRKVGLRFALLLTACLHLSGVRFVRLCVLLSQIAQLLCKLFFASLSKRGSPLFRARYNFLKDDPHQQWLRVSRVKRFASGAIYTARP